jgi:hypothetical protein
MTVGLHSGFAAGMIRSPHQVLNNIETQNKLLMGQSYRLRRLIGRFKAEIKIIKAKKGAAHGQEAEAVIERLLQEIRAILELEMKEEYYSATYGATAEKLILDDVKTKISEEVKRLVSHTQIPISDAREIIRQVRETVEEVRKKKIKKQAQIALRVRNGSISVTLSEKSAMAFTQPSVTRGEKRAAYRAGLLVLDAKRVDRKLKQYEALHDIDKIKMAFLEELDDDEKAIAWVCTEILYAELFMKRIREQLEDFEKQIERIGNPANLKKVVIKLEREWNVYMSAITKTLQQLRFSIAPAEEGLAAAA